MGALLGWVPRVPSERLPLNGDIWGRCPTTGSSPHPLRPPVYQSRPACAGVVLLGFRVHGATCGTLEPRTFREDSHTGAPPRGGEHHFALR